MTYNPEHDPIVIEARKTVAAAETAARAKADRFMKDDQLSRSKGKTPEHIEARKRVAALFCELHLAHETPEAVKSHLDAIDYTMPLGPTNARGIDLEHPKGAGFLGMGRKPAYLASKEFAPKSENEPIYALEYYPLKP